MPESTNITLEQDAQLPFEITPDDDLLKNIPLKSENILLTGATGFLGMFLLNSLLNKTRANIYCLIRPKPNISIEERLWKTLAVYDFTHLIGNERIIPVQGDIEKPDLGLSKTDYNVLAGCIDNIYHNAASVNYLFPYIALKRANVDATDEIIRFGIIKRLKCIHYISTIFIFSSGEFQGKSVIYENFEPRDGSSLKMGYSQTKWVAEKKIHQAGKRGIPVTVHRIGRISGDTKNGICQTKDILWKIIKACIQFESYPDLNFLINISPVDYVSNAIVEITTQKQAHGKVFHIVNPHTLTINSCFKIIKETGYKIDKITFDEWKDNILNYAKEKKDDSLFVLIHALNNLNFEMANRTFDMSNTLKTLKGSSLFCPQIDKPILKRYLDYFVKIGFIKRN